MDYSDIASARLVSQLATGTTTGVTAQANRVNTSYVTFPTGQFILILKRVTETDTYIEKILVASGTTQNATTGIITFGTFTRNLSLTNGADTTGTSATITWPSGTLCYVSWTTSDAENAVRKDEANTLTGSGAIRSSSTSTPVIRLNNVTTAQKNAMSAANGDMVYDTDLNQFFKYEAGAWAAVDTGTFSNAADGTGGKVDLATAAEVAAGTATDATSSAPNVIPVSIVKTTSSGAVNGTVPALNAAVALDVSIGGTGVVSPTSGALLIGAGSSAMTLIGPGSANQIPTSNGTTIAMADPKYYRKCVFSSVATSTTLTNPTSATAYATHTYTIPANDLAAGVWYECITVATITHGTSGNFTTGVKLGSTTASAATLVAGSSSGSVISRFILRGTAAAGAAAEVRSSTEAVESAGAKLVGGDYTAANFATNGTLAIAFEATFGTSNGSNVTAMVASEIWKCSTTPFA